MGLDIVMFKNQFTPQQKNGYFSLLKKGDPTENPWLKESLPKNTH